MSIYGYTPMTVFYIVLALIFGACMGSFLNCAAWRVARGESFLKGHSHCTSCGHELGAADLIPVLSWVFLGGKCRYCGAKVPARYPLTEIAFALITVACLLRFDLTVLCLRNYIFLAVLFLLTLTDIDDMTIPDGCHLVSIIAWVVTAPFIFSSFGEVVPYLIAVIVYGGGLLVISLIMDRIMGRDTLGGGDIKLFGVIGLYLGMIGTLFTMMIACIAGLIFNAIMKRRSSGDDDEAGEGGGAFPFGPWIAMAAALMLLFGEPLIGWYTGLLG